MLRVQNEEPFDDILDSNFSRIGENITEEIQQAPNSGSGIIEFPLSNSLD